MKAIKFYFGWICMAMTQMSACQQITENEYAIKAEAVDESGKPVNGIKVITGRIEPMVGKEITYGKPVTTAPVLTDSQGIAMISFKSIPEPSGNVTFYQDDWYSTTGRVVWSVIKDKAEKLQMADIRAVLKPVKHPIPMHAYDNTGGMGKIMNIPEFDREYEFDLMMAEALPPLGKGKVADFKFTISGYHHGRSNYDMVLKVRFSNPEDGVIEFSTPQRSATYESIKTGSALISDYEAPETGYVRDIGRHLKREGIETTRESNVDFRRNFYFRTRTKTDPEGRIISAHYGKIYGDFQFDAANKDWGYVSTLALLTTYFNPTPNDRNVEFDPKRNLNPVGNVQRP